MLRNEQSAAVMTFNLGIMFSLVNTDLKCTICVEESLPADTGGGWDWPGPDSIYLWLCE